ncbi:MAG: M20/M25/M40 family metallo-hydrolase [Chitinophagaceae bacterium]|nr:M20/M25/M40 family metallo-hydrolase [Chitinophagaceae bacterium]
MKYIIFLLGFIAPGLLHAQSSIKAKRLLKNVTYLASDELAGRWPGSAGDSAARKFIMQKFRQAGVIPVLNNYEQDFDITVKLEAPAASNFFRTGNDTSFVFNRTYAILPFSGSATVSARVILADEHKTAMKALQQFNNSWVLLWRRKLMAPASDSLSDYFLAKEAAGNGAAGVVFVTPDSLDKKDALVRLRPRKDEPLDIPVVQLKREASRNFLEGLDKGRLVVDGGETFLISNRQLTVSVKIDPVTIPAANIVGMIEGTDPVLKNEYILLGAHYDHLGYGGYGTGSLKPDTTAIHNGADDNASGTSALLEIAGALARDRNKLKRSVMVVAFAAEEEGLLGSQYFADHLPVAINSIKLMLNMDMLGRLNAKNELYMGGAGTFPGGVEFMKSLEEGSGLKPVIHAGGVGGSDHVSFYRKGISCIGFHTGGHPQYHTPEDDANLINAKGIEKVARYIYRAVAGFCNREQEWGFVKQD